MDGIGDTLRVSITGELEKEIEVGRAILKASGRLKGLNIISCPTCGRIEADLIKAVAEVEAALKDFDGVPLNLSVMGCAVNAIGEAKHADVAIAYGKNDGLIMVRGEVVAKLPEDKLVTRFLEEVKKIAADELKNS
jgi:(E)-4-hydroxy-3-methylbut-2-enyl-diphosphate synthase